MKLVEQSWNLRVRINRCIEKERDLRESYQREKIERLFVLSDRAYAQYLRWLKNQLS